MNNADQPLLIDHPLVRLARLAVETYVRDRRLIAPVEPLPADERVRRGVFVTLLRGGAIRGCVGTLRPLQPNLAAETIANAVGAAVGDPRFSPLHIDELHELAYVLDLIGTIERINTLGQLDPACYGLSVRSGRKHGVVLPNVGGIATPEEQHALARRRAGIEPDEPVAIERFTVQRAIELSGSYQADIRKNQ